MKSTLVYLAGVLTIPAIVALSAAYAWLEVWLDDREARRERGDQK